MKASVNALTIATFVFTRKSPLFNAAAASMYFTDERLMSVVLCEGKQAYDG